jgi:hypothetical protein
LRQEQQRLATWPHYRLGRQAAVPRVLRSGGSRSVGSADAAEAALRPSGRRLTRGKDTASIENPHELVAERKGSTSPGVPVGQANSPLPVVVDLDVAIAWFDQPSTSVIGCRAWPRFAGATLDVLDVV